MPKKKDGVQPFEEDILDEEDIEPSDDELLEEERMAKETAKAKARRASEVDDDEEDEEDEEDTDSAEDEEDDEDEEPEASDDDDDDEGETEEEDEYAAFAPFIVHADQDWDLDEVLSEALPGETIYLYHLEKNHFYVLRPIKIGEIPGQ